MSNKTPNSGATTPIGGTSDAQEPEESAVARDLLPDTLVDLMVERVVRILYRKNPELKREHPKLRKRTVIEKITQIDPHAYLQGVELSAKLNEEFVRAAALIKELRAEREAILRLTHPERF